MEVINRFKRLIDSIDLVDRVPEELWAEVHNTLQEAVYKSIPKKKKSQKTKWLSEEALQIAEERREVKSKGEKKRYTEPNTGFQRIARRDKKAFFNEQCIKLEENNRRGKTRDLVKKIGNIKGTFFPKMGTIRDRSGQDLVWKQKRPRRDGQKKRWPQNCTKKVLMTQITTMVCSLTQSKTF